MKRFALTLIAFTLLLIGGFAGFNFVVDPYNVTRLVSLRGFNLNRSQVLSDGARVSTADQLLRGAYRTVLLGNSRVVRGLPARAPWPGRTLNAGMASNSAFELGRAAILAGRSENTECAVIALELEDFNSVSKVKGSYWMSALPDASRARSLFRQMMGAGTFRNSYETVRDNVAHPEPLAPAGAAAQTEPGEPGAPRAHFELMARDSFRSFRAFTYDPERMRYLTTIIDRLTARGVQVVVFFSPIHAWREEGIFRAGREEDYFRIRRDAVRDLAPFMTRTARAPCVAGPALQMWDFSGYQGTARTDPPSTADTESTRYYFEASHFTLLVGDAVLRRIGGLPTEDGPLGEAVFGVRADPGALDALEANLHARRAAWLLTPSGREASARFDQWTREDPPQPSTKRFFIDRDDWSALDRDLPVR